MTSMVAQAHSFSVPFAVLGFVGPSGTGKTTMLKQLIPQLKDNGLKLGLIKHTHHKIIFDNDLERQSLFNQGINMVVHSENLSLVKWHHQSSQELFDAIHAYRSFPIDLLLVEGFKHAPIPKIELHRKAISNTLICNNDPYRRAIASDTQDQALAQTTTLLKLNDIDSITHWIIHDYMKPLQNKNSKIGNTYTQTL